MSQPLAAAATPLEQIEHDLQPRLQRDLIEATLLEAQVGATLSFEYRFVDVTEVRAPTPWQPFSNTIRALVVADDADGDDAPTKWLRLNGESIRYFPIESTDPVCVTQYRNLVLQHVLRAPAALSPKGRTKRPAAKRAREEDDAPPPPPPLAAPVANTISLSNDISHLDPFLVCFSFCSTREHKRQMNKLKLRGNFLYQVFLLKYDDDVI